MMNWMDDVDAPAKVTGMVLPPYRLTVLFTAITIAFGFLVSAVTITDSEITQVELAERGPGHIETARR